MMIFSILLALLAVGRDFVHEFRSRGDLTVPCCTDLDKFWPATTCRSHSVSTFVTEPPEPPGALGALQCDWWIGIQLYSRVCLGWSFETSPGARAWRMASQTKWTSELLQRCPSLVDLSHSCLLPPCYCSLTVCLEYALFYQAFTGDDHLHMASTAQGHPN